MVNNVFIIKIEENKMLRFFIAFVWLNNGVKIFDTKRQNIEQVQ